MHSHIAGGADTRNQTSPHHPSRRRQLSCGLLTSFFLLRFNYLAAWRQADLLDGTPHVFWSQLDFAFSFYALTSRFGARTLTPAVLGSCAV